MKNNKSLQLINSFIEQYVLLINKCANDFKGDKSPDDYVLIGIEKGLSKVINDLSLLTNEVQ